MTADWGACDDSTETLRRVGAALRCSLECWRCGTTESRLTVGGDVNGEFGTVPLFVCADCARSWERLYRTAFGRHPSA